MHVYWPDGSETVISNEGGWLRRHGGKTCAVPPKKYRKILRPVVKKFVRRAGRMIPVVGALFWLSSIDAAAQDLAGRKNKNIFDYIEVGVDNFSPITGDDVGMIIKAFQYSTTDFKNDMGRAWDYLTSNF